jgi:hypothetical protein
VYLRSRRAHGEGFRRWGGRRGRWEGEVSYGVLFCLTYREERDECATYMVKQSYMKLSAAGPTTVLTSSGIGGAWLREPSL